MRGHWAYLKYVLRHKYFVFLECVRLGIPFLGILHDWSKFSPSEWFPYVHSFFNPDGSSRDHRDDSGRLDPSSISREFDFAWLHHIHSNPHHWNHWSLVREQDENKVLRMPDKYAREMLADWRGAGMAKWGEDNTLVWYARNEAGIKLHPGARAWIEKELQW